MICDVSERNVIQDIKNNTQKKQCELQLKKAGIHLNWCTAVEIEKVFEFLELLAQLWSQ